MWIESMNILLGILLAGAVLFALYALVLLRPRGKKPGDPRLLTDYAHRGLHGGGVPENSMTAFRKAVEAGYGIELDVQLSRDGEVMVFHDYTLTRMTGRREKLSALSAAELQALSLDGTDETIPTFRQVLQLVDGTVPLLVELKGENLNTALCEKTAALLRDYKGPYCVESFNPLLLRAMKKQLPHVFYGLLYTNVCRDKKKRSLLNLVLTAMSLNVLARPDFLAFNKLDQESLPVRLVEKLYGLPRFVWTVKTQEELQTAKALGEHVIFENVRP